MDIGIDQILTLRKIMNKKTITVVSLGLALAAIAYVTYSSLSQLKDIDYDTFDEESEDEDF